MTNVIFKITETQSRFSKWAKYNAQTASVKGFLWYFNCHRLDFKRAHKRTM